MLAPPPSPVQFAHRAAPWAWPLIALGAGALTAGGFPPLGLWPLTLFGLATLVALTARARAGVLPRRFAPFAAVASRLARRPESIWRLAHARSF